jgi:hypothetical protein
MEENKQLFSRQHDRTISNIVLSDDEETMTMTVAENVEIKFESYHDQACCEHVYADFSIMQATRTKILRMLSTKA